MIFSNLLDKVSGRDNQKNDISQAPKDTYLKISEFFKEQNIIKDVVIVCIGTNRTNVVDCLGPFVGSLLKEDKEFKVPMLNLFLSRLLKKPFFHFVLSVDPFSLEHHLSYHLSSLNALLAIAD